MRNKKTDLLIKPLAGMLSQSLHVSGVRHSLAFLQCEAAYVH